MRIAVLGSPKFNNYITIDYLVKKILKESSINSPNFIHLKSSSNLYKTTRAFLKKNLFAEEVITPDWSSKQGFFVAQDEVIEKADLIIILHYGEEHWKAFTSQKPLFSFDFSKILGG